ncbi:MAG: mutM [Chloroflexi bacterium]|nr:mutM [Chloroflexota bacterium]
MPELPEVETLRRQLAQHVAGERIVESWADLERITRPSVREFVEGTEGTRILDVCRWGKQLFMPLDSGAHLLIHLGMSGRLHLEETPHESSTEPPERKHVHAVLSLESGHRLVFTDQRTFGELGIAPNRSFLAGKGPDPTDAAFDPEPLVAELGRHRVKIKAALLDQRLVAGLGNIYADEVCFLAQVHPATLACDVPEDGRRAIVAQLRPVLEQAIAAGGVTLRDGMYQDMFGTSGSYRPHVYGNVGNPCSRCGAPIDHGKLGTGKSARSYHFCPRCQIL